MLQGEPSLSADVAGVSQVPVQALHATYVTLLSPTHGQRMEVAHFVVRCLSGEVRATHKWKPLGLARSKRTRC
jgi:hypothetical protein